MHAVFAESPLTFSAEDSTFGNFRTSGGSTKERYGVALLAGPL
jgi:hypothetical protein